MPISVPSLTRLKRLSRETIVSTLAKGEAVLRVAIEHVIGDAVALTTYLFIESLREMWPQLWSDSATGAHLDRRAKIYGISRNPPGAASGRVKFTGVDGSVVPVGTELGADDGVKYKTSAAVVIASGQAFATVTAQSEGLKTNKAVGVKLKLSASIAGVNGTAEVVTGAAGEAGLVDGVDAESDTALQARLGARIATPPKGGHEADYVGWARQVSTIVQAWAFGNHNGPGTVLVLAASSGGTLSAAKKAEIEALLATLKPAVHTVTVQAPTLLVVAPTIQISPNTAAVQAAVTTALQELFRGWVLSASATTIRLSQLTTAIGSAAGEDFHVLVSPNADVALPAYNLPSLGAITWQGF